MVTSDRYLATLTVPLLKAEDSDELRVVTGVVLVPDVVDAHNDIVSAEVIRDAAYDFLAKYNDATKLGVQHKLFGQNMELVESYVAPVDFELPGGPVALGSWVLSVRILDDELWAQVLAGTLTGFSIGATATVLAPAPAAEASDA